MNSKPSPGQQYQPDNYNEETELTLYVWENYSNLMTNDERFAHHLILVEKNQQLQNSLTERIRVQLREMHTPFVGEDLQDNIEAFRKSVRERVLRDCKGEIYINRCPECHRIVSTPKARQFLWCGYDWH